MITGSKKVQGVTRKLKEKGDAQNGQGIRETSTGSSQLFLQFLGKFLWPLICSVNRGLWTTGGSPPSGFHWLLGSSWRGCGLLLGFRWEPQLMQQKLTPNNKITVSDINTFRERTRVRMEIERENSGDDSCWGAGSSALPALLVLPGWGLTSFPSHGLAN